MGKVTRNQISQDLGISSTFITNIKQLGADIFAIHKLLMSKKKIAVKKHILYYTNIADGINEDQKDRIWNRAMELYGEEWMKRERK